MSSLCRQSQLPSAQKVVSWRREREGAPQPCFFTQEEHPTLSSSSPQQRHQHTATSSIRRQLKLNTKAKQHGVAMTSTKTTIRSFRLVFIARVSGCDAQALKGPTWTLVRRESLAAFVCILCIFEVWVPFLIFLFSPFSSVRHPVSSLLSLLWDSASCSVSPQSLLFAGPLFLSPFLSQDDTLFPP